MKIKKSPKLIYRFLSLALLLAGIALIAYPQYTQIVASNAQKKMLLALYTDEKNREELEKSLPDESDSDDSNPLDADSTAIMAIEIGKINLKAAVVRGTDPGQLKKAPGFYPESQLPGEGNTAIAAHRTTYGAWFRDLDQLEPDDLITITYQGKEYKYRVERVFIIAKNDWSVIDDVEYPCLTLTACHPAGSAQQRIVVRANIVTK